MNGNGKTKFDSVILAGGFGKRLSPLTDTIPKPMLPIANESAFTRNLKILRKYGFHKTAVTTMYLAEKIENIKIEEGITEYFREETPLGSAGAVSVFKNNTEDFILVISGDAIFDYDLSVAKEEFVNSGCDAAIVLCRTNNSCEYGSVTVSNGTISGFCEKPSVRDTLSDLINTGIYFISQKALALIPDNRFYDFAKDLFPTMIKKGMKIAAIEPKGHWFDIGTPGEFHRCNIWMNGGESCIGKRTSIHPAARIDHAVIFDNVTVGNSVLRGCIIGENAVIGNDCIIPPGCVIGPGAELRDGTALSVGTVVNTGETLAGESYFDCFPRPKSELLLDDDYIIADDSYGYFVKLGRKLGNGLPVIAFAEGKGLTLPKACELACGVSEAGGNCTIISGGSPASAAFAAMEYRSKTAFIAIEDGNLAIRLFTPEGMPYSREDLRKLSDAKPNISEKAGNIYLLPHGSLIKRYLSNIKGRIVLPRKMKISDNKESALLRECAEELGIANDENGAEYYITENGEQAAAKLPDGREVNYWQLLAICCIEGNINGILLPRDTPNLFERILRHHSIDIGFYNDSESEERSLASTERLPRDGILLAFNAAALSEKCRGGLAELVDRLPPFSVTVRTIYTDKDKMTSIIAELRSQNENERNAGFDFGEGRVSVFAGASGRFRLVAEATDSETAEEISLKAIELLEKRKNEDERRK